jgi:hypothetical protein
MNHKELITRLRVGAGIERERVLYIGWSPLANKAADAIEELQAENDRIQTELQNSIARRQEQMASADFAVTSLKSERDTLRQQLAEAQRDAERYRWMRDNSASISWNPSRFNSEIVSGFAHAGTGYLGFNFDDAIKEAMKGTA